MSRVSQNGEEDYSPEELAIVRTADIFYWLLYKGERLPWINADLTVYAPFHEGLQLALTTFNAVGGGAAGADAVATLWPFIRRKWPALAAAVAGQDIRKATQAQLLIRLGIEAELFETSEGQAYARVPINGSYDVLALTERGSGFQPWLARRFYEDTLGHPSSAAMAQAMLWLRGQARYGGLVRDVHTRVAWEEGTVYLDLTNAAHQVVKITADGWGIDDHPPVYFRRASGALPLPFPDDEGSLEDLFGLINLPPELADARKLIAGWLLHTLMPDGPYAHLCIHGEQGSAKSFLTKVLRQVIDPNKAPTKSKPKEEHDLAVMARHSHILAFDNLSSLPEWLSDALCQLSTGAGLGTRTLYTDDDETVFFAKRPALLNGIAEVAVRGDLIDRCLFITLPTLQKRADERQLWKRFQELRPRILGAVVKAVCTALKNCDDLTIHDLPRMADFTLWVEAAAPAFGWKPGEFLTAYRRNRASAVRTELEASPVARALLAFMANTEGTVELLMGELLKRLTSHIMANGQHPPDTWPKSPQAFGGALRRLAPALRAQGIRLTVHPHGDTGVRVFLEGKGHAPLQPRDGVADVIFNEGHTDEAPDELPDEPDERKKSSSGPQAASSQQPDEPDKPDHLFLQSLREKEKKEIVAEREVGESSSDSSGSSDAAMGMALQPDERKNTSSGSSGSSSANGARPHTRGRDGRWGAYPRPPRR
jgi:hypothetical protein